MRLQRICIAWTRSRKNGGINDDEALGVVANARALPHLLPSEIDGEEIPMPIQRLSDMEEK